MRDNVSIIFAVLVAVVVLIIFPLFSLMSRQDSIAYNKVLTLTTEFVDSVRTKGSLTEQEYTNYLAALAMTGNTYNVQFELHEKILINDINNTSDEPVYVEDTLVYYNKEVTENLIENGKITFKENDEFYIKLYNTNITTASLLYATFARTSVPPKVINIGYGGKVSHIAGNDYSKRDFSSSYSPYIKFGEVVNEAGENNKECYDELVGAYNMEQCIRVFSLHEDKNHTLTVPFALYNFNSIDGLNVSTKNTFDTNKDEIAQILEENISLRGMEDGSYIVDVDSSLLEFKNGVIAGTIKITGGKEGRFELPETVANRTTRVVIAAGLGTGVTDIVSPESYTHDFIFARELLNPEVELLGPFNKQAVDVVRLSYQRGYDIYFRVKLTDFTHQIIGKCKVIDVETGKNLLQEMDGSETLCDIQYVEVVKDKEYWVKVTYRGLLDRKLYLELPVEMEIQNIEETVKDIVITKSEVFDVSGVLSQYKSDDGNTSNPVNVKQNYTYLYNPSAPTILQLQFKLSAPGNDSNLFTNYSDETKRLISSWLENSNIKLQYASGSTSGYDLNYTINSPSADVLLDGYSGSGNIPYISYDEMGNLIIAYTVLMHLSSTTETFTSSDVKLTVSYADMQNNINNFNVNGNIKLRGIKLDGFYTYVNYTNSRVYKSPSPSDWSWNGFNQDWEWMKNYDLYRWNANKADWDQIDKSYEYYYSEDELYRWNPSTKTWNKLLK